MNILLYISLILGYIYEDSDSLIVYNDTLNICGQHTYNIKIHAADTARLFITSWTGSADSTGWLVLNAPDIHITGLSMITADGAGYWGGTDAHADGYGQGYGGAGNLGGGGGGGAGYGGTGGNGGGIPGYGGISYGTSDDTITLIGSGGGAGRLGGVEGFGGNGGASVLITANSVRIDSSSITSMGAAGYDAVIAAGGGGSGGGIMIRADSVALRADTFAIEGGPGGDTDEYGGYGGGGAGGGRLKVFYHSFLDTSDLQITYGGGEGGIGGWGNGQPGMPGTTFFGVETGISQIVSWMNPAFIIRPNPTRGTMHITTKMTPAQIKLYDISGRLIMSLELVNQRETVDLRDLQRGVYFMIAENQEMRPCKIVVID
ncbi:MAG: T9SS type A sorting domain-containing protein [candidate division WOR-3 bacterium]|nr:T9SS type A sorting domain-containing protein [candidate division WOR-3 bacterium]